MQRVRAGSRQRRPAPRVLSRLLGAVLVLGVLATVAVAAAQALGQLRLAPVLSGSMTPQIYKGDLVVAQPVATRALRAGDVLLFNAPIPGRPAVVHRIYDVVHLPDGEPAFHTKGDANGGPDPWTIRVRGNVSWRVRHVVPHAGALIGWLHRGALRMVVLVMSVLMLTVVGLQSVWATPTAATISWRWLDPHGARHQRARRRMRTRIAGVLSSGAVVVAVLALTGLAAAQFTASPAAPVPAFGSGSLAAPSPLSCTWTSATALSLAWTNNTPGFTLSYDVQRSNTSGSGYASIGTPSPDTTTTLSDSPSPVTTARYYVVDAKHSTWSSAHSNEQASNGCIGALNLVAGTTTGFSGDNAAATSAQLAAPSGVAVDSSGNVYIADTTNNRIRKVAAGTGIITTYAGGGASTACTFSGTATSVSLNAPRGVAVDSSGNVYIADTGNNCVRKVVSGTVSQVAGGGASTACSFAGAATAISMLSPRGIAVDSSGNVYIADSSRNCIRKVTSGNISLFAGSGATATCSFSGTAASVSLSLPSAVAVDSSGTVYIADTTNNCIRKVASGTVSQVAGGGATTTCSFAGTASTVSLSAPTGVAIDSSGRVVVADSGRRCVRLVSGTSIGLLAGTGTSGSTGDNGPAIAALLITPAGVAANSSGDVWIVDSGTHRVRRVEGPT